MTDTYSPDQAFARDLLIAAVNGGINRWARVHGYLIDAPAEQVRAEGIDLMDRSVWSITLADLTAAIDKLINDPAQCAEPGSGIDTDLIDSVSDLLAAARAHQLTSLSAAIGTDSSDRVGPLGHVVADVVFQVAVADEVIY